MTASSTAGWVPDDEDVVTVELPLVPQAAAQARRYVTDVLRSWSLLDELGDDVVLVASELVANAVRYGDRQCALRLDRTAGLLRLSVSDGSPLLPRQREHAADENGRGLFIVSAVSRDWGSETHGDGKTVWVHWTLPLT